MKLHETAIGKAALPLALVAALGAGCSGETKPDPNEYKVNQDCKKPSPLTAVHIEGSNLRGELQMVNDGDCAAVYEPGGVKKLGHIANNQTFLAVCANTKPNSLQVIIEPDQLGTVNYANKLVDTQTGDRQLTDPMIRAC